MDNEVMVLTKGDLEENPTLIGENLAQLAIAMETNKKDLSNIKDRGFWKQLRTNNTQDLAEAMIKQNEAITAFLTIVQGVIFLSMNNLVVLGGIMESLNSSEESNELRDNKYVDMAKDYLTEAILAARKTAENEGKINHLESNLVNNTKSLEEQGNHFKVIKEELKDSKFLGQKRDKLIKEVGIKLENNTQKQERELALIQVKDNEQEHENKLQFNQIKKHLSLTTNFINAQEVKNEDNKAKLDKLVKELKQLKDDKDQLKVKLNDTSSALNKKLMYAYICSGVGVLTGVIALLT